MESLLTKRVLMVTGVFSPEINGAVLQCAKLMDWLVEEVDFKVLTGSSSRIFRQVSTVRGIEIIRIGAGDSGRLISVFFLILFVANFILLVPKFEIVHVHGFSIRNAFVILFARMMRKRVLLKRTSFGQDDPITIEHRSRLLSRLYRLANDFIVVSPEFLKAALAAGIDQSRIHLIPNAVNVEAFCPASVSHRTSLRAQLGFSESEKLILYVGHFSQEKRPTMVYEAWRQNGLTGGK